MVIIVYLIIDDAEFKYLGSKPVVSPGFAEIDNKSE
jgi:hypothetical protein